MKKPAKTRAGGTAHRPAAKAAPKKTSLRPTFWTSLQKATKPLLCLDFDGTLVPHHRDRMSVRLPPPVKDALEHMVQRERTRIVLVTSRPANQMPLLLGGLKIEVVGEHGWERMTLSGKMKRFPINPELKKVLAKAIDRARKRGLGARVETKRTGVALYTRGLPPSQANLLQCVAVAEWTPIGQEHKLTCFRSDSGVELRDPAHDKGSAVRAILEGHRKPDFVVYVGNDQADGTALELVKARGGHPMAVGGSLPDDLVVHRFPGPDAVGEFLLKWNGIDNSAAARAAKQQAKAAEKAGAKNGKVTGSGGKTAKSAGTSPVTTNGRAARPASARSGASAGHAAKPKARPGAPSVTKQSVTKGGRPAERKSHGRKADTRKHAPSRPAARAKALHRR